MKATTMHLILMFASVILTIIVFQLLGEILSREIEISTISKNVHSIINEAEFSIEYFREYFRNFGVKNFAKFESKNIIAKFFLLKRIDEKTVYGKIEVEPKSKIEIKLEKYVILKLK